MILMWTHLHKYLGCTFYGGFFMVDLVKVHKFQGHTTIFLQGHMHAWNILLVVVFMWTQRHSFLGCTLVEKEYFIVLF
jgi:hypothetical protein